MSTMQHKPANCILRTNVWKRVWQLYVWQRGAEGGIAAWKVEWREVSVVQGGGKFWARGRSCLRCIRRPFMKPVAVVIEYSGLKSKFRGTQGGAIR